MAATTSKSPADQQRAADRILVGSCHSQHYLNDGKSLIWASMAKRNASAFVWAGDAVYGDDFVLNPESGKMVPQVATPLVLQQLYQELLDSAEYRNFVMGTIDDHDYGINNGDTNYEHRVASAELFVDFLKRSNTDNDMFSLLEQRAKAGRGIYSVQVLDFARKNPLLSDEEAGFDADIADDNERRVPLSNRSVAIFHLDIRSHKTPWKDHRQELKKPWSKVFRNLWRTLGKPTFWSNFVHEPDYSGDFLGAEQWKWLATSLRRSTAAVNIVVSGIQVHADKFFDGRLVEDWSQFPSSQHRLYQLLLQSSTSVSAPILVSGDVHMAELARKDCRQVKAILQREQTETTRPLMEVTTSGMTHSWGTNICARPRSSWGCRTPYLQYCLKLAMDYAHLYTGAWREVLVLQPDHQKSRHLPTAQREPERKGVQYTLDLNFAEFEFDWDKSNVIVSLRGIKDAPPILAIALDLDELNGRHSKQSEGAGHLDRSLLPGGPTTAPWADFHRQYETLQTHGTVVDSDDWICVPYRGAPSPPHKLVGALAPPLLAGILMSLPITLPSTLLVGILIASWVRRQRRRRAVKQHFHANGNGRHDLHLHEKKGN
jgi:PhoD-like phosphatase